MAINSAGRLLVPSVLALAATIAMSFSAAAHAPDSQESAAGLREQATQAAREPSAGAAYRVRTFDLRELRWAELVPYGRPHVPLKMRGPLDRAGVPMRRVNGRLYYAPTDLGIQALRRLKSYRRTGNPAYLEQVLLLARKLRSLSIRVDGAIWLPFRYDVSNNDMKAPWFNALAQGTALALFSRLHRLFERPGDLRFAHGLFRSFQRLPRPGHPWVTHVDSANLLWFEHWPAGVHGKVLNAHAYAVFGLRDYWQQVQTPAARRLLEGGITTLRVRAERFRRPGTWSWKNLVNPVAHRRYHGWHVSQLLALAIASGDPWFSRIARQFASDYP